MISEQWQKNLYAIFIAQFLVMMGFSFVNPFLPLFIQQLGNFTNEEAAFWASIAAAGLGIALFASGPFWGIIADKWGRKAMLLRAQFCSVFILIGVGLSPSVYWVIALRVLQGFFSGTMTAAQAMVAAGTPREKMPFAMGLLLLAVFSGNTIGPLMGGFLADAFGYHATFYITGGLLFLGGLTVLLFTKEEFRRPEPGESASLKSLLRLALSRQMLPLLLTIFALQLGPQMIQPIISIYFREIDPTVKAATMSGITFCLMAVLAALSSLIAARLGSTISLKKILIFSCLGVGLLYLPPIWAGTEVLLIIFIALTGLFSGGIMTSSNALIGLSASRSQQGMSYGIAQSASALGMGAGPLIGGVLSSTLGLRAVFGVASGLFVLIALAITRFFKDISLKQPQSDT
jgi:DHA1 family multidrug resistance protein-like MFS transporter